MPHFLLIAAVSYLLGSIPFGYLLVRIFRGEDVRQSGSGNIGATNVSRKSPALGVLTLLLDALKGTIAVWLTYRTLQFPGNIDVDLFLFCSTAAVFAVVGHMFPIWLGFRGGKGVATSLGAFALIAPHAILGSAAIFLFVAGRVIPPYLSLASITASLSFHLPYVAFIPRDFGGVSPSPLADGHRFVFSDRQSTIKISADCWREPKLASDKSAPHRRAIKNHEPDRHHRRRRMGHRPRHCARTQRHAPRPPLGPRNGCLRIHHAARMNERFLPGRTIPDAVTASNDLAAVLKRSQIVVSVMPSQHCRASSNVCARSSRRGVLIVSATKASKKDRSSA